MGKKSNEWTGLTSRRAKSGWSQERIAAEIGVDRATLSRWEAGKRTPHSVFKLLWIRAIEIAEGRERNDSKRKMA